MCPAAYVAGVFVGAGPTVAKPREESRLQRRLVGATFPLCLLNGNVALCSVPLYFCCFPLLSVCQWFLDVSIFRAENIML